MRRPKYSYEMELEDETVENMTWSSPQVRSAALFAATRMASNEGSHDFKHVLRVYRLAMLMTHETIVTGTPVDKEVVEMAALLHDVFYPKAYKHEPGAPTGTMLTKPFLQSISVADDMVDKVAFIANNISYSKQAKKPIPKDMRSIEMDIVQDADRLDAMGAIGVARCFAYGGHAGHKMEKSRQHFDEKLVKLSALIQTEAGAKIASRRQKLMLNFLNALDDEYAVVGQVSTFPLKMTSKSPQ